MSSENAGRGRSIAQKLGGGALGLSILLAPTPADAAPPAIELSWSAPANCPDRELVLRAIRELVGEGPAPARSPEFWVRGEVALRDGVFWLDLSWRSASERAERTMSAKTCDELARAAALIVALAANPERSGAPTAPPNAPRPSSPSEAPSARSPAPRASSAPFGGIVPTARPETLDPLERPASLASARSMRVRIRSQMAVDVGALPRTGVGLGVGATIPLGLPALQMEALVFAPQSKSIESGGGGEFWLAAFAVRPCIPLEGARLRLMPCAVSELELLNGEGEGLDFREGGAAWFLRFGLGADVAYPLSERVGLVMGAWFLAAPLRPDFVVENENAEERVHRPASLGFRSTWGLELGL